MGFFGLTQRLEPVGNLVEALLARSAGHTRIHVSVFVGLAGDRRLKVVGGTADRLAGCRITGLRQELEMAKRMARLPLSSRTEHGGDIVVTFDVGLLGEIKIAAIGLGFAGKCGLQIVFCLGPGKRHGVLLNGLGYGPALPTTAATAGLCAPVSIVSIN